MLIPLFPQVTGFKIENLWRRGSHGLVRCTARLSRALRSEESDRIERLANISVSRTSVVHECREEDVEEWHRNLVQALAGVDERKARRAARRRAPDSPRFPGPAA
jgi:GTP1/Obg family GTP-binding protein